MSLFDGRIQESIVNLTIGAPGQDILEKAYEIFKDASKSDDLVGHFQYGAAQGSLRFRRQLANFLQKEYQDEHVEPENLLLTCGASQGLHLIITSLLKTGKVFVEDPTYFLATTIFAGDFGLDVIPADFQNTSKLEELVLKFKPENWIGEFWALFYIIPVFHNPTGKCMNMETQKSLVQIARQHGILIVCDDVYNLLWYETRPSRLLEIDKNCPNLLMNCSFSKMVAPGLRLGWIEASPLTIEKISSQSGLLDSGGAANSVISGIMANAMEKGLVSSHLNHLRIEYGIRMKDVSDYFVQNLPPNFKFEPPKGGYFIWIEGPENFDASQFSSKCKSEICVEVMPGEKASGNQKNPSEVCLRSFRISIAFYPRDTLMEAARKLCSFLKK